MEIEVKHHAPIIYEVYEELKRHIGKENAISAKDLCFLFPMELCMYSISEDDWAPDVRRLREVMRKIRRSGELEKIPCSCNKGYYVATSKEEAQKAINRLLNAAKNEFKTAHIMAKKLGLDKQMKIQFGEFFNDTYHSLMEIENEANKEAN